MRIHMGNLWAATGSVPYTSQTCIPQLGGFLNRTSNLRFSVQVTVVRPERGWQLSSLSLLHNQLAAYYSNRARL